MMKFEPVWSRVKLLDTLFTPVPPGVPRSAGALRNASGGWPFLDLHAGAGGDGTVEVFT
jgi:hypothetical protein